MPISNPIPSSVLTVAETQVFDGTALLSWTDLDLSAVVGANLAFVLLKVGSNAARIYGFRQKGDTDEQYDTDNRTGNCIYLATNTFGIVVVVTDAAGVIQWRTSTGAPVATIDVIGYIV